MIQAGQQSANDDFKPMTEKETRLKFDRTYFVAMEVFPILKYPILELGGQCQN